MPSEHDPWRPSASLRAIQLRATCLAATRQFFSERKVLEVETPLLVGAPVTDVNLQSVAVDLDGQTRFLHTSPEYAMKRLLAAGSGDIYQICKVARGAEASRLHSPEFTLLEWYRCGQSMRQLIDEVTALLGALSRAAGLARPAASFITYREVFRRALRLDPLLAKRSELLVAVEPLAVNAATLRRLSQDELLDLLMGALLGPALGHEAPVFVTHYPATQAALAQLDPQDPRVALRFELYWRGMELANGFQELTQLDEQRARFDADNIERRRRGLPVRAIDTRLLAALANGLPACAGVAVGFDRLLMALGGFTRIDEVLAFTTEHA